MQLIINLKSDTTITEYKHLVNNLKKFTESIELNEVGTIIISNLDEFNKLTLSDLQSIMNDYPIDSMYLK
jgi:hypothetical protein